MISSREMEYELVELHPMSLTRLSVRDPAIKEEMSQRAPKTKNIMKLHNDNLEREGMWTSRPILFVEIGR